MPRLNNQHWLMATGENWGTIVNATGATRADLANANAGAGYTYNGTSMNKQPVVGEVVHLPFR